MIPLNNLGIIQIQGGDASTFLQRQFTNDVFKVTDNKASFGAYLTPKGRVIANFLMIKHRCSFLLVLDHNLLQKCIARLRMFVMRDKVYLSEVADWMVVGCNKDQIRAFSQKKYDVQLQTDISDSYTIVRSLGSTPRFYLIGSQSDLELKLGSLGKQNSKSWKLADIECGLAWIGKTTTEKLVPQAINLDLVGGVSFSKGCYPGQEIVARLHYRGGVNRRLIRASTAIDATVSSGDSVRNHASASNLAAVIVNHCSAPNRNSSELLLSTPLKLLKLEVLHLDDSSEVRLRPNLLPYDVPQIMQLQK